MSMAALHTLLGARLQRNQPLARYTAARLGGPADYLYVARESVDELGEVVMTAWSMGMPVRVLGGGANVLVSDAGVRGLVVINKVSQVDFGDWHDGRTMAASSGTALTLLAHKCQVAGLAGMEWAVAVPGTVGGAVVNNAGAHGTDTAAALADTVVLEASKGPQIYSNAEMHYAYRGSQLKARDDRHFLVLLATFVLPHDDPAAIKARMADFNAYRKRTQPNGASLGSIFKNPPGDYAGRLIEAAGLKGQRAGGVMVSPVHANFFINDGTATASDYHTLIRRVQESVAAQFSITLELEIELVGEWTV